MGLEEFKEKINQITEQVLDLDNIDAETYHNNPDIWKENQTQIDVIYKKLAVDLENEIKRDAEWIPQIIKFINKKLSDNACVVFANVVTDFLQKNEDVLVKKLLPSLIPNENKNKKLFFANAFKNCDELSNEDEKERVTKKIVNIALENEISIDEIGNHCSWDKKKFDQIRNMVKSREKEENYGNLPKGAKIK